MITWENVKTGKILSFTDEKQFYNSVNSKFIKDLEQTADEIEKEDRPFNPEIVDSEYKRQAEMDEENFYLFVNNGKHMKYHNSKNKEIITKSNLI